MLAMKKISSTFNCMVGYSDHSIGNDAAIASVVLGGVIIEPFQRLIPPQKGFLEGLREITEHYEIPLIFDEVVTGFRFAYGGAQEYYCVEPDICTLGKAVAG